MKKLLSAFAVALLAIVCTSVCWAQSAPQPATSTNAAATAPVTAGDLSRLEAKIAEAKSSADNAKSSADNGWMLVSALLVLMMTCPGLALFYGGLVRKKNVISVLMQSFAMMAVISILWAVVGYSLAFAPGNSFVGGFAHLFLHGVGAAPNPAYSTTIPAATFMIFQLMFAIITPALITGAFAERMKFSSMLVFLSLWSLIVYAPLAHMIWGVGGLLNASTGAVPTLDFAGGTVVEILSGLSSLVAAIYIGRRIGYPKAVFVPHSMVISFTGASLLWVGWFGFNAGSALGSGSLATSAFVATHFAAAAAVIGWSALDWMITGKPSLLGSISGAVAGMVAITPAAGYVGPFSAMAIGLAAGVICFFAVTRIKAHFCYDDTLDVFGVHGVGGTLGLILTGVFASRTINPAGLPGAIEGAWKQVLRQTESAGISWGVAIVGTLVLLFLVDKTMGLRVSQQDEIEGLDLTQHNEEGYAYETQSR
jgi:Amt family ammonium transporter